MTGAVAGMMTVQTAQLTDCGDNYMAEGPASCWILKDEKEI